MVDYVSGQKFSLRRLGILQVILVILLLSWFVGGAVLTRMGLYPVTLPPAGQIGLIAIIVGTFARLLVLADQFRRARLYRLWLLSYMLILLILAPVVAEIFEP
ncbi:hypothetical protein KQH82_12960 [bacterium]|nr:hypothetical protein [bacterium]